MGQEKHGRLTSHNALRVGWATGIRIRMPPLATPVVATAEADESQDFPRFSEAANTKNTGQVAPGDLWLIC